MPSVPPDLAPPSSRFSPHASLTVRLTLGLCLGIVSFTFASCKKAGKVEAQQTGELGKPVARIDDEVITVGDIQERINKQSPFVRARFASMEKRKEFLDNIVRFEVMAKEAEKQGYAKDPEVVRTMKQQMISKFLQKEFDAKLKVEDVPDADVERYYKEHPDEFNRPDQVRVSQIVVKDKAKADKALKDAKAIGKDDDKAFREFVMKVSEDPDSKPRGGDLLAFDAKTAALPKEIVDGAFALTNKGDTSPLIKTEKGFVVLRLVQKIPGFSRPLPEVKRQIQQRLFRDLRTKALDKFVDDLKLKAKVTIDEGNLAKVQLETGLEAPPTMPPGNAAHSLPGMPVPHLPSPGNPGTPAPSPSGVPLPAPGIPTSPQGTPPAPAAPAGH